MAVHFTAQIRRRTLKVALVVAIVVAATAPIAAFGVGGRFTDDDNSTFESNIEWLAGAGVTLGCNPPANDNFCPTDNVTRGQMAAFMQRFAAYLGAEDGTVSKADDADTIDGVDSQSLLRNDVVEMTQATGWVPNGGTGTTVEYVISNDVLGAGGSQLGLVSPSQIGTDSYYLDTIEICYGSAYSTGSINSSRVFRSTTASTGSFILDDFTVRTTAFPATECYQLAIGDVATPSNPAYRLLLNVTGSINVVKVTSTYRPQD